MEQLKIKDADGTIIEINSIDDLYLLPDKSIELLFNNSGYMTVLYLFILFRIDAFLVHKQYSRKTRIRYFNLCLKNLNSLLEYEKEFLVNNSTAFTVQSENFPKNLKRVYRDSVIVVCNFFRGMLVVTSHLDKNLYKRDDTQLVRHNYGNTISTLLNSVET